MHSWRLFIEFVRGHGKLVARWFVAMVVTLFPVTMFPHSGDVSIFLRVADALRSGLVLYKDIVDIKPPLVYDLASFLLYVSGGDEVAIHVADALLILVSLFIAGYLLVPVFRSAERAFLSTWLMAVTYVSIGYVTVIQAEALSIVPMVILIVAQLRNDNLRHFSRGVWIGSMLAVLIGLKLSLGAVVLVLAISDVSEHRTDVAVLLKKWTGVLTGFLVVSAVIWRSLLSPGALDGFGNLLTFMGAYASEPVVDASWFREAWKSVVRLVFDHYSVAFAVFAIVGAGRMLSGDKHERRVLRLVTFLFVVLMGTMMIERKFFTYHFVRASVPLSIVATVGAVELFAWLRRMWSERRERLVVSVAIAVLLVWSPLFRIMGHAGQTVSGLTNRSRYDSLIQRRNVLGMYRAEEQSVADSILRYRASDDNVVVAAIHSPRIALLLGKASHSFAAASQFALADYAPDEWRRRYADEMHRSSWIVAGVNDSSMMFNTKTKTSLEIIEKSEPFRSVVKEQFRPRWQFEHYVVYERRRKLDSVPIR